MKLRRIQPVAKGAQCETCGMLTIVHQYRATVLWATANVLMCWRCVLDTLKETRGPVAAEDQAKAAELDWLARAERLGESDVADMILDAMPFDWGASGPAEGDTRDGGVCQ